MYFCLEIRLVRKFFADSFFRCFVVTILYLFDRETENSGCHSLASVKDSSDVWSQPPHMECRLLMHFKKQHARSKQATLVAELFFSKSARFYVDDLFLA